MAEVKLLRIELIFPKSTLAKLGNARGIDGGMTGVVTALEGVVVTEEAGGFIVEGVEGVRGLTVVGAGAGMDTGTEVVTSQPCVEAEVTSVSLRDDVDSSVWSFLSSTTKKTKKFNYMSYCHHNTDATLA